MTVRILQGDCRDVLKTLPDDSVHCVVTSPPYYGLRDYGVAGQIGLEASPDDFLDTMVAVFAEVRRVLRADGTAWVNMGDSYANAGGPGWQGKNGQRADRRFTAVRDTVPMREIGRRPPQGFKAKDLIGMPWRLAFALQADGWWLRQDIIWHKPNPMPESITDRCTKAHEYVFLLAKSERYHYDAAAIAEPIALSQIGRVRDDVIGGNKGDEVHHSPGGRYVTKQRKPAGWDTGEGAHGTMHRDGRAQDIEYTETDSTTRNKRSVWTVPTNPFPQAHFATFPPSLIEPCILAGCPEGGTVLDPFGGAGTTGLVADRHGRNAILIELNPEYAEMARKRIFNDAPLFADVA